jgi:hypothetical protein
MRINHISYKLLSVYRSSGITALHTFTLYKINPQKSSIFSKHLKKITFFNLFLQEKAA